MKLVAVSFLRGGEGGGEGRGDIEESIPFAASVLLSLSKSSGEGGSEESVGLA